MLFKKSSNQKLLNKENDSIQTQKLLQFGGVFAFNYNFEQVFNLFIGYKFRAFIFLIVNSEILVVLRFSANLFIICRFFFSRFFALAVVRFQCPSFFALLGNFTAWFIVFDQYIWL